MKKYIDKIKFNIRYWRYLSRVDWPREEARLDLLKEMFSKLEDLTEPFSVFGTDSPPTRSLFDVILPEGSRLHACRRTFDNKLVVRADLTRFTEKEKALLFRLHMDLTGVVDLTLVQLFDDVLDLRREDVDVLICIGELTPHPELKPLTTESTAQDIHDNAFKYMTLRCTGQLDR